MKRLFPLILTAAAILSACAAPDPLPTLPPLPETAETEETATVPLSDPSPFAPVFETEEPAPLPVLPSLPALYYFKEGGPLTYEKITSFEPVWRKDTDVGSFGVAPEVEPEGRKTYVSLWNKGVQDFPALADFKTGFTLTFETAGGETFTVELRRPSDTKGDFNAFLDVYLYDDVANAGKSWYSHMEEGDFSETSLITSVKLTGRDRFAEVTKVSLSAYLYNAAGDKTEPVTLSF